MGASNGWADVVHYSAMWITQRTGENTAVTYPLWAAVLGMMVLCGVAAQVLQQAWPLLVVIAVAFVGYLLIRRYGEQSKTANRLAKRFREREDF